MKIKQTIKIAAVLPMFSFVGLPAVGQGILDQLDDLGTMMSCTIRTKDGALRLQVGINDDSFLRLIQDGITMYPIIEGTEGGQYEVSDDRNRYAINMDPSIGMYYIFDFKMKRARMYALSGMIDFAGDCN